MINVKTDCDNCIHKCVCSKFKILGNLTYFANSIEIPNYSKDDDILNGLDINISCNYFSQIKTINSKEINSVKLSSTGKNPLVDYILKN